MDSYWYRGYPQITQIFAEEVEVSICANLRNLWIAIGIGYPQMTQIFAEDVGGLVCAGTPCGKKVLNLYLFYGLTKG